MNSAIVGMLVWGFLGSSGGGLDRPLSWTCADQVNNGDLVRLVAETGKRRFVVTEDAAAKMVLPAPCLAGGTVSAGSSILVLEVFGGLKVWMPDEVMVWFDSDSIPSLLDNDFVTDVVVESQECLQLDAVADFDLHEASIGTFAEELSSTFGVRCVYEKESGADSKTVTLNVEGIDAGTVLAIACDSLGVRYQRFPGWLRLSGKADGEFGLQRSAEAGSVEVSGDCYLPKKQASGVFSGTGGDFRYFQAGWCSNRRWPI